MFFKRKKQTYRCNRCKIEITDTECKLIDGHRFCLDCAQLPPECALDSHGNRFSFSYPVIDMQAEDIYWDDEIDRIHCREKDEKLSKHLVAPERARFVEIIRIRTKEDSEYPSDNDYDLDTALWVYTDEESHTYYFKLCENFLSLWDGFPVYCGGYITHEEAKEIFRRIGNHRYDHLFAR